MKPLAKLVVVVLAAVTLAAQEPENNPSTSNKLISGKLMYVGPMPAGLDQWVIQDLKDWGKYKPTEDPEGADLVMKSYTPPRPTEFEMRNGVPQPKGERRRKNDQEKPPVATIRVTDWVTGETLWDADILDQKPKKDETESTTGRAIKIFAKGMSSQQLASRIVEALRRYLNQLAPAKELKIPPLWPSGR